MIKNIKRTQKKKCVAFKFPRILNAIIIPSISSIYDTSSDVLSADHQDLPPVSSQMKSCASSMQLSLIKRMQWSYQIGLRPLHIIPFEQIWYGHVPRPSAHGMLCTVTWGWLSQTTLKGWYVRNCFIEQQ